MADMEERFPQNPLLRPKDLLPSHEGLTVECILNPGAFEFQGKAWLLIRVAERPLQKPGLVNSPIMENGQVKILEFSMDDPALDASDPRSITYDDKGYLTTLSHLRLASSDNGIEFEVHNDKNIFGLGDHETFGIEDCRVTRIDGTFFLTYTAVSDNGYGVGMISTKDWSTYHRHGIIISGPNKDCALFDKQINETYYCLHRPSMTIVGGNDIWLAQSPDLEHWGKHQCIARTRPGMWDSVRIGAGASPIKTEKGWLEIYHGADEDNRYCLGALLLDPADPSRVIARSDEPIMKPEAAYETTGFFGNVVFTNGHIVDGDKITLYYGAYDEFTCAAELSITEILSSVSA
ncbi:MAG: glycosidase [Planctomycetes bacterium]|nr:glycosidase [Planctomycetota bacterium]